MCSVKWSSSRGSHNVLDEHKVEIRYVNELVIILSHTREVGDTFFRALNNGTALPAKWGINLW